MKYLLLFALLAVAYMVWRNARIAERTRAAPPPAPPRIAPQDMVCCPVCSVHLPRSDAVAGPDGKLYCSHDHRLRGGG